LTLFFKEDGYLLSQPLLVIDMLHDFLDEKGSLYIGDAADQVKKNVKERLFKQRSEGKPVIYVMDRHLPGDAEFKMFPPHCLAGEWGAEVIEDLVPEKGDFLVVKRRYSAFFGTDLDIILRENNAKEIELAGVCTQICILYTAAEARMLNYEVTVRKDCVASFDLDAHRFALREMEHTLGVKVI
jgi:nicotinamidase/pyrazinamidase